MSLLRMPTELLLQILGCLGSSFFCEDPRRLAVSRQWFLLARKVFLEDVRLSPKSLEQLLYNPSESRLAALKQNLRSIDLQLNGLENKKSKVSDWDRCLWLAPCAATLDQELNGLITILQDCKKLRALRLTASREFPATSLRIDRFIYLWSCRVLKLITLDNLTTLTLDTCGTMLPGIGPHHEGKHLCASISSLLTTLRHLRLRMRSICPVAFRLPKGDTPLPLMEVVVNISIYGDSPKDHPTLYSRKCGFNLRRRHPLKEMQDRAKLLVARMSLLRRVRILSGPAGHLKSWDALTGKRRTLADGAEWDDERMEETLEDNGDHSDDDSAVLGVPEQ
ncbi:hypothetical protein K469DRAFT_690114 [Zopfia rhizophila CBS 207.26]|uniref:F-box domain-containing protein n=1 Tax=Zopfia rhizophila CBS 207.26 TaxID=1314779 RepID=A0A6A6DUJ8_9PEZI|nr:hypothetical protein K469DRAFT_690114 [Zopfia rhizophila CBS 207.26]